MGMFESGMFNIGRNKYDDQTDWGSIQNYYKGKSQKPSEMFGGGTSFKQWGDGVMSASAAPVTQEKGSANNWPTFSNWDTPAKGKRANQWDTVKAPTPAPTPDYDPNNLTKEIYDAIHKSGNSYDAAIAKLKGLAGLYDPDNTPELDKLQQLSDAYGDIDLEGLRTAYDNASLGLKGLAEGYRDPDQIAALQDALQGYDLDLSDLGNSYDRQVAGLKDLAGQYQDDTRINQLEDMVNNDYNFDQDRYRAQAQYQIQKSADDLAQATMAKLINAGQLNSSAGQNYFAGTQAKYLMPTLSALEDKIKQYDMDYADRRFSGIKDIANIETGQKDRYADVISKALGMDVSRAQDLLSAQRQIADDKYRGTKDIINLSNEQKDKYANLLSKALGLDIEGADKLISLATDLTGKQYAAQTGTLDMKNRQKDAYAKLISEALNLDVNKSRNLITDLGNLMQGEINWDTFLSMYANPGDYTPTSIDFPAGKNLTDFLDKADDLIKVAPAGEWTDWPGLEGYKIKYQTSPNGDIIYTYKGKDGKERSMTLPKNGTEDERARALWAGADDTIKKVWMDMFFGGYTPDKPDTPDTPGTPDTPNTPAPQSAKLPDDLNPASISGNAMEFVHNVKQGEWTDWPELKGYKIKWDSLPGGILAFTYKSPDGTEGVMKLPPVGAGGSAANKPQAEAMWAGADDTIRKYWADKYGGFNPDATKNPSFATPKPSVSPAEDFYGWMKFYTDSHGKVVDSYIPSTYPGYVVFKFEDGHTESAPRKTVPGSFIGQEAPNPSSPTKTPSGATEGGSTTLKPGDIDPVTGKTVKKIDGQVITYTDGDIRVLP